MNDARKLGKDFHAEVQHSEVKPRVRFFGVEMETERRTSERQALRRHRHLAASRPKELCNCQRSRGGEELKNYM